MNKTKLTALCAKTRGISPSEMAAICYDPLDDANHADDLLEYVADAVDGSYMSGKSRDKLYWASILPPMLKRPWSVEGIKPKNLAKILCSLRASPEVTDAEIEEALK